MKKMKKILALLLSAMLVLSMTMTAWADPELGSITINGAFENINGTEVTYSVYRMLDLESYNTAGKGSYSYVVNSDWTGFFVNNTDPEKADALDYVTISDSGYVTWKEGVSDVQAVEFAQMALAYAKANNIQPIMTSEEAGFEITDNKGVFSDLSLGYYLVDSTVGVLCGLTTTNPHASINSKNGIPEIDKQVKEDSPEKWGESNIADIGEIIDFRIIITVHEGAEDYILHDHMSPGLTFKEIVKIEHVTPGMHTHNVPAGDYVLKTSDLEEDCTFEIHFSDSLCDKLETNDNLIIYYKAMLNRNAVIASDGNANKAKLEFGDTYLTEFDQTNTHTYGIDIVKTDSQNTLLDGAKFRIYDAPEGGNEIGVVELKNKDETEKVLDENNNVIYRRARADEAENTVDIVVTNGLISVIGLDSGTYYLKEIEAPKGYNALKERHKFIISNANLEATFNGDIYSSGSGVHIVNNTGTMLPETGARGTMMFITFGMIVVLGTGVLLVTKKRMGMIQE